MHEATYLIGSTFAGNRTFSDDIVGKIIMKNGSTFHFLQIVHGVPPTAFKLGA
jgi:hypothetical protein